MYQLVKRVVLHEVPSEGRPIGVLGAIDKIPYGLEGGNGERDPRVVEGAHDGHDGGKIDVSPPRIIPQLRWQLRISRHRPDVAVDNDGLDGIAVRAPLTEGYILT